MDVYDNFPAFVMRDSIKKQYCDLLKELSTKPYKNDIVDATKISQITESIISDNFMFDLEPLFDSYDAYVDTYNNILRDVENVFAADIKNYEKMKIDRSIKKFYPSDELQSFIELIKKNIKQIENDLLDINQLFENF